MPEFYVVGRYEITRIFDIDKTYKASCQEEAIEMAQDEAHNSPEPLHELNEWEDCGPNVTLLTE